MRDVSKPRWRRKMAVWHVMSNGKPPEYNYSIYAQPQASRGIGTKFTQFSTQ